MNAALMLVKDNALIVGFFFALWASWKVSGWKNVVDASIQLQAQNIERLGKNIQDLTNNVQNLTNNVQDLTNKFIRLDARVDALSEKIDVLSNKIDTQVAALSNKIDTKVATLSATLSDKIDTKVAAMSATLSDKIDTKVAAMSATLSATIDTKFAAISEKVDGLQSMFMVLLDRQIAKSGSPRTLTDYGAKLSQQIDAPSLAAYYAARLREKIGSMNAWQIQELCFNHAEHEIMKDLQQHDIDRYNQITMCAYREGIALSKIMLVVGIVMRDQLLQQAVQLPRAQTAPAFLGGDSPLGMSHP